MKYARIKPSKEESIIAMVIGILMFVVDVFGFLPNENAGLFSILWNLIDLKRLIGKFWIFDNA